VSPAIDTITEIRPIARPLYQSFFTSSGYFKQVQNELGSLLTILETTEETTKSQYINTSRHPQLCDISQNCYQVLDDLQQLKDHFDSVGTQTQKTWERLNLRADDLESIRTRIRSYVGLLTLFNTSTLRYIFVVFHFTLLSQLTGPSSVLHKKGSNR
jgi:hypothetical protein